ncbi:PREDICTED: sarcalumenin isoform X1 [Drosophila arizonae]|uniref:Sarcalumenin isoform X1 n=1 Tax=Drosophila arizonae TaxID=7263 RepID=A0ABM1Q1I1_DROAR|nr:PREDICTED: sarcalumenin isoform X1 [Drosophila arizonae]XP_017873318.1 PREDICTED: sarcalumenin isoform X1 [Drosophila arizonae]
MGRLTLWFLLGLTLIAVSNNVGLANADAGPSESECRPYIEKAINELKTDGVTGKDGSGELQADQPRGDDDDDDDGGIDEKETVEITDVDSTEDAKSVNDLDGDGIPDDQDDDIDGDGIPNDEDDDIDGDGIPNDKDDDIDGDGIPNEDDDDIDGDGIPNTEDDDIDGDGIPNDKDDDIDGDGIPNEEDDDIDGDGIPNDKDDDLDGDGIPNDEDADIDGDGVVNEKDNDIDGDGIPNAEDNDLDGDGLPNEKDEDLDGDGLVNHEDEDIDGDGTLNHEDGDLDGDGLPNDKDEDLDGDGKVNHEDEDIDGDGTLNHEDSDIDGDGVHNDEDHDVDGDGLSNSEEPQSMDIDGDGVPNNVDDDIDGDNKVNEKDDDMDGDGILNEHDNDMDGDGIPNDHDDSRETVDDDDEEEEVKKRSKREVDAAPVGEIEAPPSPAEEFPAEEEKEEEAAEAEPEAAVEEEPVKEEELEVEAEAEPEPEAEAQPAVAVEQQEEAVEVEQKPVEEAVEPEPEASGEAAEEPQAEETAVAAEDAIDADDEDTKPEDELLWEGAVPQNRRSRQHITELLLLDEEFNAREKATDNVAEIILRDIKKIYENAIKPLETLYKYRDLSNRHFGDPEIFSKPLILFMGPWSGGKSSILNYLTDNEYTPNSLRTGAEPSPAYFNILMWGNETEVLDGTQLAADYTFSGLQKFGQGLEERLRGLKLKNKLLEKVNIVEIPGILEVRKQVSRVFPFNDACQWFIDRADIIFLVYDPAKLDVGPETEAILDQLKGREYQTRIILNKADTVKPEELLRVQGALIWNISPLMSSAQPPLMYTTSLWTHPYQEGAPARLLLAQERAFLRDLRTAIDKRIEHKIASARRFAVRVRNHAKMVDCYLNTYYNHKTLFGNKKRIADDIIDHPQNYHIYEGLSTLTNISRYDLPDPDVYRDFFRLNPLYEFKKLSETCTYFRGCPITKLDLAIAYELPELAGKYKKMSEAALASIEAQAQTQAQAQPSNVQAEPRKTS